MTDVVQPTDIDDLVILYCRCGGGHSILPGRSENALGQLTQDDERRDGDRQRNPGRSEIGRSLMGEPPWNGGDHSAQPNKEAPWDPSGIHGALGLD